MATLLRPYHVYGVLTTTPSRLWRPYRDVRADVSGFELLSATLQRSQRVPAALMAFLRGAYYDYCVSTEFALRS